MKVYDSGVYLVNGTEVVPEGEAAKVQQLAGRPADKTSARQGTIAYGIMKAHNTSGDMERLKIKFDAMTSHDITYVGIIQTARASGMTKFPLPYVLTCRRTSWRRTGRKDDHRRLLCRRRRRESYGSR